MLPPTSETPPNPSPPRLPSQVNARIHPILTNTSLPKVHSHNYNFMNSSNDAMNDVCFRFVVGCLFHAYSPTFDFDYNLGADVGGDSSGGGGVLQDPIVTCSLYMNGVSMHPLSCETGWEGTHSSCCVVLSRSNHTNNNNNTVDDSEEFEDAYNNTDTKKQVTYTWDDIITLPCSYRDLTRDAYVVLNVCTPSSSSGSSKGNVVYTTKLKLFDVNGKMKVGLQQIKLRAPSSDNNNINSDDEDDDENEFVHDLYRSTFSSNITRNTNSNVGEDFKNKKILERYALSSVKKVAWLDDLVLDVIHSEMGEVISDNIENLEHPPPPPSSSSSNLYDAYLTLTFPIFQTPLLHNEQPYPPSKHTGPNGSVTPLDIIANRKLRSEILEEIRRIKADRFNSNSNNNTDKDNSEFNQYYKQLQLSLTQTSTLSLLTILDWEYTTSSNLNPVEYKHFCLHKSTVHRDVIDTNLKPNKIQKNVLDRIINNTSLEISNSDKDLLWTFRFSLVDDNKALTKFLLSVNWQAQSEVMQATELLHAWRLRSPIGITDALKLLGGHVQFNRRVVKDYAVETLMGVSDDEIVLYLLQLVQAIKYDDAVWSDDGDGGDSVVEGVIVDSNKGEEEEEQDKTPTVQASHSNNNNNNVGPLGSFLITRACKSTSLANFLYWYLKVEIEDKEYGYKYTAVFEALKTQLVNVKYQTGSSSFDTTTTTNTSDDKNSTSVWNLLEDQDSFFMTIANLQQKSRDSKGKKDAKELLLKSLLKPYTNIETLHDLSVLPVPLNPDVNVEGVKSDGCFVFRSGLYPAVVVFRCISHDEYAKRSEMARKRTVTNVRKIHRIFGEKDLSQPSSPSAAAAAVKLDVTKLATSSSNNEYSVIFKSGDDLRQDQLVISFISLFDNLLQSEGLDLKLTPYSILATSTNTGLVEFVEGSIPVSQVLAGNDGVLAFFKKHNPSTNPDDKHGVNPEVIQTYIRSCAGYCVITYILGIGDRHLDNIMLKSTGEFFHIDFGFIFGRDPKPLPPPFRLTQAMVDGMGGKAEFKKFKSLCCQTYNTLRKSAGLVSNLLNLSAEANIPDLSANPIGDAGVVINKVEEKFRLDLTDEQAEFFFEGLIMESLTAFAPKVLEVFHQIAVARR